MSDISEHELSRFICKNFYKLNSELLSFLAQLISPCLHLQHLFSMTLESSLA